MLISSFFSLSYSIPIVTLISWYGNTPFALYCCCNYAKFPNVGIIKTCCAVLSSFLCTSVQKHGFSPGCTHMNWNCPYIKMSLSAYYDPSQKRTTVFFFSSHSFPPSHTDALYLNKQRDAGLSCSIVLFGESCNRGWRLWAGLNSEFDMAPVQFADLLFLPQSATCLIILLPCFSQTRRANNVRLLTNGTFENGLQALPLLQGGGDVSLTFSHWAQLVDACHEWHFN